MMARLLSNAEKVHTYSILPRSDEIANMAKIDQLNQMLVNVGNEQGLHFVNNFQNFQVSSKQ